MARIRVYVKKKLIVGSLAFRPQQMYKLGQVGTLAVKKRAGSGTNIDDGPAKKLSKGYAIFKTRKFRRKAIRDLTLSGEMLNNLQVRTVSNTSAEARNSTRKDRAKANRQQQIEPWMLFSRANQTEVLQASRAIFSDIVSHLVKR